MSKVFSEKEVNSVNNNIFLSSCSTSEAMKKLGFRKSKTKTSAGATQTNDTNKGSNALLSRYDTKTVRSKLQK